MRRPSDHEFVAGPNHVGAHPVPTDGPWAAITAREREVLGLYLQFFNDKKVARTLGTRPQTVRNQLASIEHKLGAESRAELVALVLTSESFDRDRHNTT